MVPRNEGTVTDDFTSMRLAWIVVNFGSSALLEENLAPAVKECRPEIVVVVDCWSSKDERQRITALGAAEGWHVLALPDNRGFGGGMNAGVGVAHHHGATHLLLVNPDARVGAEALVLLQAAAALHPMSIAAPRVIDAAGRPWFDGAVLHLSDGATTSMSSRRMVGAGEVWEWISGACMILSMTLWDAVGGFDESYFLYWEDVDLSQRVRELGGSLFIVPGATIVHDEGGTHTDRPWGRGKSATYYQYRIRNRMLFATKHLDAEGIRRWRRSAWRNAWAVLMEGGRRQLLHPVPPLAAAWRGVSEGRAIATAALKKQEVRRAG